MEIKDFTNIDLGGEGLSHGIISLLGVHQTVVNCLTNQMVLSHSMCVEMNLKNDIL